MGLMSMKNTKRSPSLKCSSKLYPLNQSLFFKLNNKKNYLKSLNYQRIK